MTNDKLERLARKIDDVEEAVYFNREYGGKTGDALASLLGKLRKEYAEEEAAQRAVKIQQGIPSQATIRKINLR